MRILILAFLLISCFAEEMAVTQEYTDYLKKHVTWEVADYEDNVFRGWTVDEVMSILNQMEPEEELPIVDDPEYEATLPKSFDWTEKMADCIHPIHNQGNCGSCWAFSAASVVADRCCIFKEDKGWLSPQELVSCDKRNSGCSGGWEYWGLDYVAQNGLVPEACYPYLGRNSACPNKCVDGSDWKAAHVCKCKAKVECQGATKMKACILTGPVTAGMWVYNDFLHYKSGVYHWNRQGGRLGGHAIRCIAFSDAPEPNWKCANSWGEGWGEKGFFRIGVGEVGIDTRNPHYCDPE